MKKKIINVYKWIKNKIIPYKMPVPSTKQIVAELEIQLQLRESINLFKHPSLFSYNLIKEYWVCFFTAIAYAESDYNSRLIYPEPKPLGYDSIGLLQLSYADMKNYAGLDIKGDKIFYVKNNLEAGLIILNQLMKQNKNPIIDGGKYWSTLRPSREGYKKFYAKFKQLCLQEGVTWNGKF